MLLEQLVADECSDALVDDPILWPDALAPSRSPADVAATLTLLTRVASNNPGFAETVTPAWSRSLPPLLELAALASDDDGDLITSLTAAAETLPVTADIENASLDLPEDPRLNALGRILVRKTLDSFNKRGVIDDRLFTALLGLGVYCGALSLHDEAIDATTAAIEWVTVTVGGESAERRSDLALSLTNLAADLAESGEPAAAVTAMHTAATLCRDLLRDGAPDAISGLAATLQNLGAALTAAGDPDGAHAATSEAVALLRETTSTETHAEQLSLALTNLALGLLHLGHPADAVGPASEAVDLWRTISQRPSTAYDEQLLKALSTLGTASSRCHHEEATLRSRRETVQVARRLYAQDPQRWRHELVRHLTLLARSLADQGLTPEEAKVRAEAEGLAQD